MARAVGDAASRPATGHAEFIDVLRGVAILMVILTHCGHNLPMLSGVGGIAQAVAFYGQMGVQLFFVASAYTLCLATTSRAGEPRPLLSFFLRRYFRIAPLYYLAIALYAAVFTPPQPLSGPGLPATASPYSFANVLANVLFVHGFVPAANNTIVPGGWSIGTEMAFYLIFPQLFWVLGTLASKGASRVLAAVAVALLADLLLQAGIIRFSTHFIHNDNFIYFNLINQLPVFVLGIYAYFRHQSAAGSARTGSLALDAVGFAACTALSGYCWITDFPLAFALVPTLSGVSFLFLFNAARRTRARLTTLAAVGRASYSMYIFHFPFAWWITDRLASAWTTADGSVVLLASFVISSAVTYTVARISRRWIEMPAIALGGRWIRWLQHVPAGPRIASAQEGG